MDNGAPWQTLLREALALLALPADEQARLNGPGCVACDMTNDFDQARRLAFAEPTLSEEQRQALEAICTVIQAMTEADLECFNNEALRRPVWQRLRELAANAFCVFGWEKVAIEPFAEVSPGVWSRAPSGARPDRAFDPEAISPPPPTLANVSKAVPRRVPAWVVLVGCLSVFACLVLCGTAVGVWVYVLKNGLFFGNTSNPASPSFNAPPVPVRLGPPAGGVAVNGRLVEPEGGFSYVPPDGWMVYQFPGLKFRIVAGPNIGGFAPNMNVVDESVAGSLEEYARTNLKALQQLMAEFRLVKQEVFRTTDGLQGVRLVTHANHSGRSLRQTYYLFGNGNTKYVVTCTTSSEGGAELDPIFEASMKTFRVERQ